MNVLHAHPVFSGLEVTEMRALNDVGDAVSWWFIYKLPKHVYAYDGDRASFDLTTDAYEPVALGDDGYRYLVFQPGDEGLTLSDHDLDPNSDHHGAITRTLEQFLGDDVADSVGYIAYNDEFPTDGDLADAGAEGTDPGDSSGYGHNKGVLAFNAEDGTAVWVIHSFPRWPAPGQTSFPSSAQSTRLSYAQTFLCISLRDLKSVDLIAWMLRRFHEPQIIHSRLPDTDTPVMGSETETVGSVLAELYTLAEENAPGNAAPASTGRRFDAAEEAGELTVQAWAPDDGPRATTTFHLMAKGRDWGQHFWIDLVAHRLGTDLLVETWRRDSTDQTKDTALHTPHGEDEDGDTVEDASAVLLAQAGCFFKESNDHGKWAVSAQDGGSLVCVGDINRQSSQTKRGGGTATFHDAALAAALREILWVTEREAAGEAEVKVDRSGVPITNSDETANQERDLSVDAERESTGASSSTTPTTT